MPLEIPGGWSLQTIELAQRRFELLLPADPDLVLEEHLAGQGQREQPALADPYWAALWSSAKPTAEFVLRHHWPEGLRAIELGCGVGLVGLAAAAAGLQVVLSDHVPDALDAALENISRNDLRAEGALIDWHRAVPAEHRQAYNVILASDVLYNRENHQPLLRTIDQLLTADGTCWLGDPGRYNSREFLRAAAARFQVQLEGEDGQAFTVPSAGKYQRFVLRKK